MVEEKTRPCPSCDGVMRRGVQEETVTFQGESLTYQQPGWHCENGDDGVLDGSDNDYPTRPCTKPWRAERASS